MSCTSTFAAETAQGNEKLVVPRPKGLLHLELCSCLLSGLSSELRVPVRHRAECRTKRSARIVNCKG